MTLVIGIQCTDGVVLAAERGAIPGTGVVDVSEDVMKVHAVDGRFLVGLGGFSGQAHRYLEGIRRLEIADPASMRRFDVQEEIQKAMISLAADVAIPAKATQIIGGDIGTVLAEALVAFLSSDGPSLTHIGAVGMCDCIDEILYHVIGSGEKIAAPFLSYIKRHVWQHKRPTIATAVVSTMWTFSFAHNCAGNYSPPWVVATLQASEDGRSAKIEFLDDDALGTHHQSVEELETAFGNLPKIYEPGGTQDEVSIVPQPE